MTVFGGESLAGFDGTPFRILWNGGDDTTMPTWSRESFVVETPIPGSDITETDLLGFGPWKRAFLVECDDKWVFNQLRMKLQTEGVLRVPAAMNDLIDADVIEEQIGTTEVYARIANVLFVALTDERIQVDGVCFGTAHFTKEPPVDG